MWSLTTAKIAGRSFNDLTAEARFILDKLDDGFEGLVDDQNFIDGWFGVRKIKGRPIQTIYSNSIDCKITANIFFALSYNSMLSVDVGLPVAINPISAG